MSFSQKWHCAHTILVVWFCTAINCILVKVMAGEWLCLVMCTRSPTGRRGEGRVVQWGGPYSIPSSVVQQFCPSAANTSWQKGGWNKRAHDCQYSNAVHRERVMTAWCFSSSNASIAAGGAFKTSLSTTKKTPFPIISIGKLWRCESSGKYVFLQ